MLLLLSLPWDGKWDCSTVSCKGCQKRHLGCHSDCEDYKAYKEEVERINKARRKDDNYSDYLRQSADRTMRKKKWKK